MKMSELLNEISMYLKAEDILNSENMIPIENVKELIDELQQKENIIKEVREYITYARTPRTIYESGYGKGTCVEICMEHLLEILEENKQ